MDTGIRTQTRSRMRFRNWTFALRRSYAMRLALVVRDLILLKCAPESGKTGVDRSAFALPWCCRSGLLEGYRSRRWLVGSLWSGVKTVKQGIATNSLTGRRHKLTGWPLTMAVGSVPQGATFTPSLVDMAASGGGVPNPRLGGGHSLPIDEASGAGGLRALPQEREGCRCRCE